MIRSHLVYNTNTLMRFNQSDISSEIIDYLMPVIDVGGGPVWRLDGWHVHFERRSPPGKGPALFQIAEFEDLPAL